MQIGDNESSTVFKNAKDFPVVSVEIREVALVQIRYCKIKGFTVQETQLLHVGDTILITPGLHSFGGFNHETAEIDTQNISGGFPSCKKSTKIGLCRIRNPKSVDSQNPVLFQQRLREPYLLPVKPGTGLPRVSIHCARARICHDSALTQAPTVLIL
jgi:hypothetical protein